MSSGYRIADEPRPSSLSHLAVNPIWPLFGVMFGGAWIAWPWFVFNGFAIGSPSRTREMLITLAALAGATLLALCAVVIAGTVSEDVRPGVVRYLMLALTLWQLASCYYLYSLQAETYGLFEYYGGRIRSGLPVVIAAFLLGPRLMTPVFESLPLLRLIIG